MKILTPHQSAALNYEKSISLTANAGSGKTFVLTKRYLEIVLKHDIPLNRIAAITFTEKAAGELYKKIAEEINRISAESVDAVLKKKLNSIRRQLISAKISTIHSFCLDILRDFPVEAELDANFVPIDQIVSNELIERSTEEAINESLHSASDDDKIKILIRLLGSKRNLARELNKLISNRKNVLTLGENLYKKTPEEIAKYFESSFYSLAGEILLSAKALFQKSLHDMNRIVLADYPANEIALQVEELLHIFKTENEIQKALTIAGKLKKFLCTETGSIKSRGYLGPKSKEKISSEMLNIVESFFVDFDEISSVDKSNVEFELAVYGKIIIEVFSAVLERYERIKKENGYLDFEDILLKTKHILTNENVRNHLVEKYKYLLVDEYQDTNEIQYQIFIPIVDYLKSNNLFVVGDEKQSIYRFRDAELEIFGRTKKVIHDTEGSGSLLTLPDSFRMSPAICLFTNILFKKLFSSPSELFNEVEHSDIICASDNPFEGRIEFLLAEENKDLAEAELISKRILMLMSENYSQIGSWRNVAVLVRKRNSFEELEKTFTKYKIPFTIVGGKGFFQRQIIYDIHNYFAFLQDQENDAALTGVLRSPFFNVSDVKILELSIQSGRTFFDKMKSAAKTENFWRVIFETLADNLECSKRNELPVILRMILNGSAFLAVTASKADSKQEFGNIDKLIKMTIDFSNEGFKSLYDYVNYLGDAIKKLEDVSQASVEKEIEGVNILTIHQAKGLEFEAVFLFNSNDSSQRNLIKAREISVNKKYGLLTKIPENQDYFSNYKSAPIVSVCNLIEDKKDIAELKRLLYVGVTRAKSFLSISSVKPDKNFRNRSFMNLLQSGLECDFNSEEISLNGTLTYLKQEEQKYVNYKKELQINIPVIMEIKPDETTFNIDSERIEINKFIFQKIHDSQSGEILSASKFSTYSQCPVKYNLAYRLGLSGINFTGLANNFKTSGIEDSKEDSKHVKTMEQTDKLFIHQKQFSVLKGRIIHSALEKNIDKSRIPDFIKNEFEKFNIPSDNGYKITESETSTELEYFYDSDEFKYLNSFKNYRNEAEIYVYENDYLLYGIIDKLIFNDKKLIVVDYKTDNVSKNELEEKSALYKNQLLFYLYIAGIKFSDYSECEGRLIFTKQPDSPFVVKWNPESKKDIQQRIRDYVSDNRKNNFTPNHSHCPQCMFSVENRNCVLEKAELLN